MDAVITHVNGNDPDWMRIYSLLTRRPYTPERFRDWGTLPYLLRGIRECCPDIGQIFLVVALDTQIPEWLDSSRVKIVLHKDIIPSHFLPTFNSCVIEMFLHRIQGLSECFLYFNDDMFPVLPFHEEDFFPDGRPAIGITRESREKAVNIFRRQCEASSDFAYHLAGSKPEKSCYLRPQHTVSPLLRSVCEEVFHACRDEIFSRLTRTRWEGNFNQYLFLDYAFISGKAENRRLPYTYLTTGSSREKLEDALLRPKNPIVCINDSGCALKDYRRQYALIQEIFLRRFPNRVRQFNEQYES
ncbi:MAG: hypothetical protein K5651_02230 [Bacteroidales bacterium]|nr:hypothetical protein [Bacteroidales bacterium]